MQTPEWIFEDETLNKLNKIANQGKGLKSYSVKLENILTNETVFGRNQSANNNSWSGYSLHAENDAYNQITNLNGKFEMHIIFKSRKKKSENFELNIYKKPAYSCFMCATQLQKKFAELEIYLPTLEGWQSTNIKQALEHSKTKRKNSSQFRDENTVRFIY